MGMGPRSRHSILRKKTGHSFDAVFTDTVEHFKSACIETSTAFRDVVTAFENGIAYGRSRFNCVNDRGKVRYAIIAVDDGRDVMVIIQFSEISRDVDEAYSRILSVLEEMFR